MTNNCKRHHPTAGTLNIFAGEGRDNREHVFERVAHGGRGPSFLDSREASGPAPQVEQRGAGPAAETTCLVHFR